MATSTWFKQPIRFMAIRRPIGVLSILITIVSLALLGTRGLNFALDFTGGTLVEVVYSEPVPLQSVRDTLEGAGYEGAVVVYFGSDSDVMIRIAETENPRLGEEMLGALRADYAGDIQLRRVEYVGPQVGEHLREQGGLAMLLAVGMVMLYVAIRFQFKFATGAALSLFHDAVMVLGFFALFQWDFDLTVLAALLAVIGYSINDTIVVFDRIRENCRKLRKVEIEEVLDVALTETLGRTMATSFSTLLVLLALYFFGGDMIRGFAMALIIGILVGTYSSIYIATSLLLSQNFQREDLMVQQKDSAEADAMP